MKEEWVDPDDAPNWMKSGSETPTSILVTPSSKEVLVAHQLKMPRKCLVLD